MTETNTLILENPLCIEPEIEELFSVPADTPKVTEAILVGQTNHERTSKLKAAEFIGRVLSGRLVEIDAVKRPIKSLLEALKLAKENDPVARALVEINAQTDIFERSVKTGAVLEPVTIAVPEPDALVQHDQALLSIQANSLLQMVDHPVMARRTEAETRNNFRLAELNKAGDLKDYSFVVFSLAEPIEEAGFFTETMSCSIQRIWSETNCLKLEPAFVSGVRAPNQERHDLDTVVKVYQYFGFNIEGKTPAEIIDTPILIPNRLIPNGIIDLVKLWDDCAGGTFFGETKPRQDYLNFLESNKARQANFNRLGKLVAHELIQEADYIDSIELACQRLAKISEKYAVLNAANDDSINIKVFGDQAAEHLSMTRQYLNQGDFEAAERTLNLAILTARSSSCPSISGSFNLIASSDQDSDEFGSLSFSCPQCGAINRRRPGRENFLKACQACAADVSCK